jgi:electron transfer flavoprotein alpha subunit/NAD-dependent dihydropyrimidine dehydrogenase PreA subunit
MPKNSKGRDISEIIPDKCIGCQLCVGECPVGAIEMHDGVAKVDPEACIGCGKCFDVCPVEAVIFEKTRKKKLTGIGQKPRSLDEYRGVAVFIEVWEGKGVGVSWELLGKAREMAGKLNTQVFGFLLGSGVGSVAKEAIAYGCDIVYMVDNPLLQTYLSKVYGKTMVHLCEQVKPEILLLGATPQGRDLASVVATQLETGLTADCTGLDIDTQERLLLMTRPTFGGNIMATIVCRNHRPQMSTVRAGVMKAPKRDPQRQGELRPQGFKAPEEALPRVIDFVPIAPEVGGEDIGKAPVLVVAGKGACDAKDLPLLERLAKLMGGTIACSRPVVQAGLLPYTRQVGQTGRTVSPKIYIGVAVSGAVQHLVGMQGSEKIIAINTDRYAPLVQVADYALVGDYREIVPKLIKGLEARIQSFKNKGS